MNGPRARLLPYNQLLELANSLQAELIMTSEPVSIDLNSTVLEAKHFMDNYQFDQLVVNYEGDAIGILYRYDLANKSNSLTIRQLKFEPISIQNSIPKDVNLSWVLDILSQREVCLVRDENGEVVGIIHISDLNRHPMRLYFYLLISATEMKMAELIEKVDPAENWFSQIPKNNRENIQRYYNRQSRQNIEITLLSTAGFNDLVEAMKTIPFLWQTLIHSPDEMQILCSIQPANNNENVRNRIMHLTKTLVLSKNDVQMLYDTGKFLQKFLKRLEYTSSAA
jgi:predicted transcriptional regulator